MKLSERVETFIEEAARELAERDKWDDSIATSITKAKFESDIERILPIFAKHLTSDAAVEAGARVHCDHFGGEGWYDNGLIFDTKDNARDAMTKSLTAALRQLKEPTV